MAQKNELRERVKRRLAQLKRSPIEAAKIAGLERNFIDDLVTGAKESFGHRHVAKVARGLDWSVSQLMDEPEPSGVVEGDVVPTAVDIPEIDVRAGASYAGGFNSEENTVESGAVVTRDSVRAQWGIPLPFLRDELHVRSGRFHILPIRGDSMVDTLYDGDRAGIDLDDTDVSQGGIFAILDDVGSVIVKQVELVRGTDRGARRIICKSRNPQYAPFELLLADPVRIIGRVACRITRL